MNIGMSLHDYQNRIVKIAERLRETLFGTENDTVFYYGAENGSDIKSIILPTKDGLSFDCLLCCYFALTLWCVLQKLLQT